MTRLARFSEEEVARARQLRDKSATALELRKALSILLATEAGLSTDITAETLGISKRTVLRHRSELGKPEKKAGSTWGGRRHYRMTLDEESEFLRPWEAKAMEGGVLSVPPVHAALVARLGRSVAISTTYRLLARHGWRKVQPDTKHPKSDRMSQEEFKKNFLNLWQPPVRRRIRRDYQYG